MRPFRFLSALLWAAGIAVGRAAPGQADTYTFRTSDRRFTPGVNNQGWWIAKPQFLPGPGQYDENDNYYVGYEVAIGTDNPIRNFFTFDLSALKLTGQAVVAARLELIHGGYASGKAKETYTLFDVTTDAATLNHNVGEDPVIWADLGSGTEYGAFEVGWARPNERYGFDMEVDRCDLNAAALADIRKAAGGFFSIGGALTSFESTPFAEQTPFAGMIGAYGDTEHRAQRLIVETAPDETDQ